MVPVMTRIYCVKKHNENDKSPCSLTCDQACFLNIREGGYDRRLHVRDVTGQSYSIYACTRPNHMGYSLVQVIF